MSIRQEFSGRPSEVRQPARLWYAAYGSNMHPERLARYLRGGTPPGGRRAHPGCRDPRPPERAVPVMLRGLVYFATESDVWGGGRAFYDPDAPDEEAPAHAYLVSRGQFSDIAAQEMGRLPGDDLDLSGVLRSGRARFGPGRYETLVRAGTLDGLPVLTFTAPRPFRSRALPPNAPSAAYLRHLGAGLMASHGWDAARAAAYLASRPGAREVWTPEAIAELL